MPSATKSRKGYIFAENALVGCFEDLRRFSDISVILPFEARDNQIIAARPPDFLLQKPRLRLHNSRSSCKCYSQDK